MRFSMSTEYAIHGLLFLALHGDDGPVFLPELARKLGFSEHTLRKVFQALTADRILVAYRGVKGGYALARRPADITLRDAVESVEATSPLNQCLVRRKACDLGSRCAVGSVLGRLTEKINEALDGVTLADLVESVEDRSKLVRWTKV